MRLSKKFRLLLQSVAELCAEWCSSKALYGPWSVGQPAAASLRHGNVDFMDSDSLSVQCCRKLRGATAWWCATGGDSGPQHGRPDGAMALNDSARFLAAGLAPALWPPESVETGAFHHV